MCGIAGRFHPDSLPVDPSWHERAGALLAHRGPDGEGHHVDERCELIHRRLALIDLSAAGRQPMPNEDGSVHVVCNGEIYNHRELRKWLESRGHIFRSTSDTEVLVHLYEEDGEQMVDRLRGMFAFAIYDQRRRKVFLARDRFAIKPLYYSFHQGQLIFASEIKAILALSNFTPQIDRQACYDFLGLTYVPEPATAFANIHALPRGTTMTMSANGLRTRQFYHAKTEIDPGADLSVKADAAEEMLIAAVARQSAADVPVAAFLSGGIDSSLAVAARVRATGEPPQTFNVRFPDKAYDETGVALAVAKHCNTSHRTIELGDEALKPELILQLLKHFDQPFADTSLIPMYWVARAVREQGIICALSGDGGDEVFGGYQRFWRANRLVQLMRLPDVVAHTATAMGGYLTAWTRDVGRQLSKAVLLAKAGQGDSATLVAGLSNYLSEEQKRELMLPLAGAELQPVYRHFNGYRPPGVSNLEELSRRMTENLFSVSLPSDMLRKVDMMSMLSGIEVRVPMLDEDMVTLGLTLPHRLKTDGRSGKLVLRELARRWLPTQVAKHPKHGFGIPLDLMVSKRFHEMLKDLLLSPGSRIGAFLNIKVIGQWLQQFERRDQGGPATTISREGLYQRIFIVLALELWLREHRLSW